MIQHLRRRHRQAFTVLALVLPAFFLAVLAARKPLPAPTRLPAAMAVDVMPVGTPRWTETVDGLCFEVYDDSPARLVVRVLRDPAIPDPLLYWSNAAFSENVPGDGAVLLGGLSSEGASVLRLPEAAGQGKGVICLYSPIRGQVLMQLTLPGGQP